jgi:hypothetical protein
VGCGQKLAKKREERYMYHLRLAITGQPNVFVRVLRRREVRGFPGGSKDNDAPHTRRRQSPTTCEKSLLKQALIRNQHLRRTDFGGRRRCMEQTGNAFAIEWSAEWELQDTSQHTRLAQSERTSPHPFNRPVRYAGTIILCCQQG